MTTSLPGPVLVLLDHAPDGTLRPAVLELVTAGRRLGEVHGAWVGDADPTGELGRLGDYGMTTVHRVDAGRADVRLSPVVGEALAQLAGAVGAALVLVTSSFENKEVAAHLGVRTGAGVVVDATGLALEDGRVVAAKSVLAGTWSTRCAVRTPLAVVAVKANAARPEPLTDAGTAAESLASAGTAAAGAGRPVARVVEHRVSVADGADAKGEGPGWSRVTVAEHIERAPSGRPGLGEAQVVVAGGRGTEGDFSAVEELADVLGGAVGATRVATDEGWIAHEAQIGQTGVTISPRLYVGAGISGAVHHRGGMQASEVIVAVNADPEAPIFEIADFGVVGDLFTVLPQAAAELRRLRG